MQICSLIERCEKDWWEHERRISTQRNVRTPIGLLSSWKS
jgi:hypothetical protein